MKRNILRTLTVFLLLCCSSINLFAQTPEQWEKLKGDINLYLANDLGRNGYYDQKPIAELMGRMGETIGPKCVIAAGDIHHFNGVASVNDPLWTTNYEEIYSHPELMIDWFPVLGNHEYRGNTQAVLDYGQISRRWMMPSRYYTKVFNKKGLSLRVVIIDTTPLINRYRKEYTTYPDARKQNDVTQLQWLDETLRNAHEDWVIVVGHHPIYAETSKSQEERDDMQKKVLPLLHKYNNVALYACGHIHNFQHIRKSNDKIDYVVNSSASLARKVNPIDGTQFCSSEPGFSVISATSSQLNLYMIDKEGKVLYTVTHRK